MTTELIIRSAIAEDIDALIELARTTFHDAYIAFDDPKDITDYVTRHFTYDEFARIISDPLSTLWVASSAHRLIGYVHLRQNNVPPCITGPNPMELSRIYLRQQVTGQGYGKALMQAVFAEARRRQRQTIWLSVYDKNVRAVEFYKRWGFTDVGKKEFLFGGVLYNDPVMAAHVPPES